MKLLLTVAALVAVAAALPTKRPSPIADSFEPIAVGPAIVDFPIAPSPVVIGPLAPGQPIPLVQIIVNVNDGASGKPEPVQVVDVTPVEPIQVVEVTPVEPVQVVEVAPVEPVQVVEVSPVEPIQVVEVTPVEPVQVVEVSPVEPIQVVEVTPVEPIQVVAPAVILN